MTVEASVVEKDNSHILEKPSSKKQFQALVIDDYFLIRQNFKLIFEKINIVVHEGRNGKEGLKVLSDYGPENFSFIIVDLVMPTMNGEEFIIKAKEKFGEKLPPILVCTSVSEKPMVKKIVSLGINGYVIKPIDFKALLTRIYQLVPNLKH